MLPVRSYLSMLRTLPRVLGLTILVFGVSLQASQGQSPAPDSKEIMPLGEVRAGMQGYAYTIFAGDQIEKFDLEVIGVMPNFLGPKQSIILVQLKGTKVEHTGVVAGMSGSPVYLEGKLAGAISLKLGVFTKEPIAGVTPIEDVLAGGGIPGASGGNSAKAPVSNELATRVGLQGGMELHSIETPLVF